MSAMYMSRIALRSDASSMALAPLLMPRNVAGASVGHNIVWHVFSDGAERKRDFLWREESPGRIIALSSRPPATEANLFDVQTKEFDPVLAAGDRLAFSLRVNAVVRRSQGPKTRSKDHDVFFDALKRIPAGKERKAARMATTISVGREWLARQGATHGFEADGNVAVDNYERMTVPRVRDKPAVFGMAEMDGILTVTEPERFMETLRNGLGRSKAFGCGLLLVRRAPSR